MFGRFLIHTFQKYLLKMKVGLNNAVILGLNRRGLAIYESLEGQTFHGLNVEVLFKLQMIRYPLK